MLRIPSLNIDAPVQTATVEETLAQSAEKRRRVVYLAIPGSIGLGLLMAILYVGIRVVSARRHASAPAPATQAAVVVPPGNLPHAAEKPVEKVQKKTKPEPLPKKPALNPTVTAPLVLITPRPGETYLQLAALSPQATLKYLDELHQNNLEPSVAPGPGEGSSLLRVVVGPFRDAASLARAKEHLNALKLEWIVRSY